ncbi:MAG: hypothetical protein RMM17_03410 [Acidobacteriota bacterium]|nr:hypothetical protein [Blastocatellia bacterium]MDW8411716.1 hypothetical protein [Acidobacteriota bacterium]
MKNIATEHLQHAIYELAQRLGVPKDSYLLSPMDLQDSEQIKMRIDGLTLAFVSFCYHKHPRGENVYELIEQQETVAEGSPEYIELEARAETAAALEIPFIVKLNELLEDYSIIRYNLEQLVEKMEG